MKRPILLLALTLAIAPAPARAETPDSDPRAVQIAEQVMQALGGRDRWDALRGLRWTFGIEVGDTVQFARKHAWDKYTGMHRVEGVTRSGQPFVVIDNIETGKGKAWVNGNPIEGDSLAKLVKFGKATWVNDSYWFLMPYKMLDPGVTVKYAGEETDGDIVYDKIALSFHDVGLTPGDQYWVYVNRANHRVEKWDKLLQGTQPPPTTNTWEGWKEIGGLWFPTAHRHGDQNVFTRDIQTVETFDPKTFTAP